MGTFPFNKFVALPLYCSDFVVENFKSGMYRITILYYSTILSNMYQ